jgi:hypothetical protein
VGKIYTENLYYEGCYEEVIFEGYVFADTKKFSYYFFSLKDKSKKIEEYDQTYIIKNGEKIYGTQVYKINKKILRDFKLNKMLSKM